MIQRVPQENIDDAVTALRRTGSPIIADLFELVAIERNEALTKLSTAEAARDAAEARVKVLEAALQPFATTCDQIDREVAGARNQQTMLTIGERFAEHYLAFPVPDDELIIDGWRAHDPHAISEHIAIQMTHLRAAKAAASPSQTGESTALKDEQTGVEG